ncbi:aminotransferase class V-fold PLP-dependent enzyme [Bacillus timonensis]|nr:aminotransferase class V-fold PLP-dependent enzyme [Bacillus timonensis]
MSNLEEHFASYREKVIGHNHTFHSPYGEKKLIYADWTASGRLYEPIEKTITYAVGPYVANPHTETSITGKMMTNAYHEAVNSIKKHVNASEQDVLIMDGSGATGVINKFQRILGLTLSEHFKNSIAIPKKERPVVFISHMEHHSNHISWLETIAEVVVIPHDDEGFISLENLKSRLEDFQDRKVKIGAFTACSNVTGVVTPYHKMSKLMHLHGGVCFVDFAASAPYVSIDMNPTDPLEKLDAIYFSPHKFLGGPGTSGVLIFHASLYNRIVPDHPGGGTVKWTNPWGGRAYYEDIEARESGGTPGFLQAIRTSLAIKLKEEMGIEHILKREKEQLDYLFSELEKIPSLHMLAGEQKYRIGIISFYSETIHYNLFTKLLNDRYGIQVRGGCSCAGTYGHILLNINEEISKQITDQIDQGHLSYKPGWVRLSIHPIMSDEDLRYIVAAIKEIIESIDTFEKDYLYKKETNDYVHKNEVPLTISPLFQFGNIKGVSSSFN